jgi:hypothetical protein
MTENGKSKIFTLYANSSNSTIVALANMGNGFSRTIANSPRKLQIRSCRCGLFHEAGRNKTTREHQGINNSEVLLAEHNLQIRSSERADC